MEPNTIRKEYPTAETLNNHDALFSAYQTIRDDNWAGPENPYADADQQPNLESAADPQQNPE